MHRQFLLSVVIIEGLFVLPVMTVYQKQALTLHEANERLLAIRDKQANKCSLDSEISQDDIGFEANIANLPHHLGWGSVAITAVLRNAKERSQSRAKENTATHGKWIENIVPDTIIQNGANSLVNKSNSRQFPKTIKLHHDLAIGLLRQELAATGRIWLLLRLIDQQGRGWVSIKEAREQLTQEDAELKVCGWRQLRNLLRKGKGIFWTRNDERIWLHGMAVVAHKLGLTRLSGLPVQIPVAALTGSIGDTKAHFYASLHSGRRHNNPISRATLEETTKVPARTQLVYEEKTGTQKQRNIAIGERFNKEHLEERAWRHGRSTFKFTDYKGKQGKPEQDYIAWRLPNSFRGSHELAPKGRMRKINQQLKDLVNKRAQGNNSEMDCRVFYPDGIEAAKTFNRATGSDKDMYWRSGKEDKRPFALWHILS